MGIYRIIFLLYAEQRGMLGGAGEYNLYLEEYSLTALRERAASYGTVRVFAGLLFRTMTLFENG